MPGRRVLVTGSRTWDDEQTIREALQPHYGPGAVLVSGACPRGADAIAERIWAEWGGQVERHPADWQRYGRNAGMIWNRRMAALGADVCLAFIGGGSLGASGAAAVAGRASQWSGTRPRAGSAGTRTNWTGWRGRPGGAEH